ncbi:uncharacterized protein LOC119685335 [Teleopsis dalmanni]|uniref:uncharacterized protein LOC119676608 n=1 Tax=Teleopsis dalmanni TaxID=139649 RepID=UPI0018CCE121|nr:uncharacterized protein LOC119676608 [Teleopsis dalmanni]XP_037955514.1 uncharacterized protein LOC119685335 [Teleopsis dalmanni]
MKIIYYNTFVVLVIILKTVNTNCTGTINVPCKHPTGMWGDVNPNIYYICDALTNTAIQMRCPEGRGFFNGFGYYGCIPFEQWPACISAVTYVEACDKDHMSEPWNTVNPNEFYMCLADKQKPLLLNCEPGRGFVNAAMEAGDNKVLGCATWEKWREYMRCLNFY